MLKNPQKKNSLIQKIKKKLESFSKFLDIENQLCMKKISWPQN